MRCWGGEIKFNTDQIGQVESVIPQRSAVTGKRIPGYFISSTDPNQSVFHISRYPRRAGQEVPHSLDYQITLNDLWDAIPGSASCVEGLSPPIPLSEWRKRSKSIEKIWIYLLFYFCAKVKKIVALRVRDDRKPN